MFSFVELFAAFDIWDKGLDSLDTEMSYRLVQVYDLAVAIKKTTTTTTKKNPKRNIFILFGECVTSK